jgi:hypothetical protein
MESSARASGDAAAGEIGTAGASARPLRATGPRAGSWSRWPLESEKARRRTGRRAEKTPRLSACRRRHQSEG